jgi:hypothetical protein
MASGALPPGDALRGPPIVLGLQGTPGRATTAARSKASLGGLSQRSEEPLIESASSNNPEDASMDSTRDMSKKTLTSPNPQGSAGMKANRTQDGKRYSVRVIPKKKQQQGGEGNGFLSDRSSNVSAMPSRQAMDITAEPASTPQDEAMDEDAFIELAKKESAVDDNWRNVFRMKRR